MTQQEIISMLRRWSQADPDRCQEARQNVFVAICSDRSAISWDANVHLEMDGHTEHFFERALRESIRDRALSVDLSESYADRGYEFQVSLCDVGRQALALDKATAALANPRFFQLPKKYLAGFKKSSFEAYLSSFAVYLEAISPTPD